MRNRKNSTRHALVFIALASLCASSHAEEIFSFGGEHVSSGQRFRLTAGTEAGPATMERPFSDRLSLNRLPGALYDGPMLFGGWETSGPVAASAEGCQIANQGSRDYLLFRFKNDGETEARVTVLILGQIDPARKLDALRAMSFTADQDGSRSGSEARAVIRVGDAYFISRNPVPIPYASPPIPVEFDPYELEWLEYRPSESLSATGAPAEPSSLFKVYQAGFRFSYPLPPFSERDRSLRISGLSVEAD